MLDGSEPCRDDYFGLREREYAGMMGREYHEDKSGFVDPLVSKPGAPMENNHSSIDNIFKKFDSTVKEIKVDKIESKLIDAQHAEIEFLMSMDSVVKSIDDFLKYIFADDDSFKKSVITGHIHKTENNLSLAFLAFEPNLVYYGKAPYVDTQLWKDFVLCANKLKSCYENYRSKIKEYEEISCEKFKYNTHKHKLFNHSNHQYASQYSIDLRYTISYFNDTCRLEINK